MHPEHYTGANYNNGSGDIFKYPLDVGSSADLPHYIRFIAKRSYTGSSSQRGTPNGEVVLYMPPDALKTQYSQTIGDVDMGGFISLAGAQGTSAGGAAAGGDLSGAAQSVADTFAALKGAVTGTNKTKVIADAAKTIGKTAVGGALSLVAGSTAGQAVSRATGQILNPHKAVVYQGPGGFRTFSYSFVMIPKSEREAKEIWKIVKFFKMRMHPGTGTGASIDNTSSVFLTYPDEFEIQYNVNGTPVDGSDATKPLFKIHNCFMETFAADYTTSGLVSFMKDHHPLTTTISLSFKETQLLTQKDIDEGY